MSIADIDALHEVAGDWRGESKLIDHPDLEAFSQLAGRFCAALGETAEEGYWGPVVRMLKRARWDAATTPLPLSSAATGLSEAARDAAPRLRQCRHVAPELATAAEDLAARLAALAESADDPLGDAVREVLAPAVEEYGSAVAEQAKEYARARVDASDGGADPIRGAVTPPEPVQAPTLGVLLRSGRYAAQVKAAVADLALPVVVLTPPEFTAARPLDLVAIAGPSAWFPPTVLRACRARQMVFIYPSWIRDAEPQAGLLAGSTEHSARTHLARAPRRRTVPFDASLPLAPAEDWVPQADWHAISAAGKKRAADDTGADPVAAWLFALASGEGVYLEATEGSRAYVVEFEHEVSVHQEPTAHIEVGDFVMLRTEGDGDYIRAIADAILGTSAPRLRGMQATWKRELADELTTRGSKGVRRALEAAGAGPVADANLRQWIRPDSIRPRDPANFSAILAVTGSRERFGEFWGAMGTIDSAHRRAGMQVRALLVEEIVRGDRSVIGGQGWADFDVEEIEGEGALRVARVEGRAPEAHTVPRTRTRRPFPIARDLWLG